MAVNIEEALRELDQLGRTVRAVPLDTQIGGDHYKTKGIQPVVYSHANNLPFIEGSVVKYVTRWRDKGGIADINKAIHLLEILKELEERHDSKHPAG
jgi:hypothetical protein